MITNADLQLRQESVDGRSSADDGIFNAISELDCFPEVMVTVGDLLPGLYLRESGTNHAHVQLLADAARSAALPPILVQRHGYRIIDGMHRVAAAKLRRETKIAARLVDCTDEEALVLAIKSNTLHGLPLSKSDRISGAKRILIAHPDWSDRAVAGITGMSTKTIAIIRNRSSDDIPSVEKRLGRDGKRRPVAAAEGRKRAVDYINAHPEASIRQIAREADVSVGTVHNILERIRRGGEPDTSGETSREQSAPQAPLDTMKPGRPAPAVTRVQRRIWSGISAKIANDPALRYTEGGRAFLRWMTMHGMSPESWREFIDAIPVHWADDVSSIADSISAEWRAFAAQLRERSESAT